MYIVISLTILLFEAGFSAGAEESAVAQAFVNYKVSPIIVVNPPNELVSVKYLNTSIYLGTKVEPLTTLNQPEVSYKANGGDLHTLLFFGPDLPPSLVPPLTQLIHWGVANIPGQDISKGVAFSIYFPPVPYPDGFVYTFLVFKQKRPLDTSQLPNLSPILSRPNFSYTKFAAQYDLGDPIAGNFMRESYLQIVPEIACIMINPSPQNTGLLSEREGPWPQSTTPARRGLADFKHLSEHYRELSGMQALRSVYKLLGIPFNKKPGLLGTLLG